MKNICCTRWGENYKNLAKAWKRMIMIFIPPAKAGENSWREFMKRMDGGNSWREFMEVIYGDNLRIATVNCHSELPQASACGLKE